MAITENIKIYKNYSIDDETFTEELTSADPLPNPSEFGWGDSGRTFVEYNSAQDGTGTSYAIGDTVSTDSVIYVIWNVSYVDTTVSDTIYNVLSKEKYDELVAQEAIHDDELYFIVNANDDMDFFVVRDTTTFTEVTNAVANGLFPIYIDGNNLYEMGDISDDYINFTRTVAPNELGKYVISTARLLPNNTWSYYTKTISDKDDTKLPLAGGTMTGTITLASTGLSTQSADGYTTDASGNFKHKSTSTAHYWHLDSNDASKKLTYYWETGNLNVPNNTNSVTYSINNAANIVYNSTTKSIDFTFN